MKYLLPIVIVSLVAVLLVGCGSSGPKLFDPISTNTGLEYRDLVLGSGMSAVPEDVVKVNLTGWLQNGRIVENTVGGEPVVFSVGNHVVIDGIDQGVRGMKVGGKRRLTIPPLLGYGSAGNPSLGIPSGAKLIYEVQLLDVKRLNWVTTASGLKYADLTTAVGPTPETGQRCYVHYTGWLQSDGTKFDENQEPSEPWSFIIGQGNAIAGFDEGVSTMIVGSTRRMIIPPSLGYGDQANGSIPANSTLIFEVELVDITNEP